MARLSKAQANKQDIGVGVVYETVAEGYEISILDMRQDSDLAPMLRGLPDDRCTSPHWGYVVSGLLTFTFADRAEAFGAGEAFYVGPGHTPAVAAGTEVVMFSPEDQIAPVNEVLQRNMAAMQGA
jgi:mannose-6-phosphate isomerase-like protein (cupin superfamily)